MRVALGVVVVVGELWVGAGCGSGAAPQDAMWGDGRPPVRDAWSDARHVDAPPSTGVCSLAIPVECGMFDGAAVQSELLGAGTYASCTPAITDDVSGPEVTYDLTAAASGTSYLSLTTVVQGTLVVFETSTDGACTLTCLAVGVEQSPGTWSAQFEAVAGHHYVVVIDSPVGADLTGHQLYWFCP